MSSAQSVTEWAARVPASEPHGLRDLEERLLANAGAIVRGGARPPKTRRSRARGRLDVIFNVLALLGPVAAATVFWNREDALYGPYSFGSDFALPVAAVGFGLALVLQVLLLREWWRSERQRDGFTMGFAGAVLLCAVVTLFQAYAVAGVAQAVVTLFLLPAWLTSVVAVVLIGSVALLGRTAADVAPGHGQAAAAPATAASDVRPVPSPSSGPVDLEKLSRQDLDVLLDHRRRAVEILVVRGLLTDIDVDALDRRPLGRLAQGEMS